MVISHRLGKYVSDLMSTVNTTRMNDKVPEDGGDHGRKTHVYLSKQSLQTGNPSTLFDMYIMYIYIYYI